MVELLFESNALAAQPAPSGAADAASDLSSGTPSPPLSVEHIRNIQRSLRTLREPNQFLSPWVAV
jgi:hypothetical protein